MPIKREKTRIAVLIVVAVLAVAFAMLEALADEPLAPAKSGEALEGDDLFRSWYLGRPRPVLPGGVRISGVACFGAVGAVTLTHPRPRRHSSRLPVLSQAA